MYPTQYPYTRLNCNAPATLSRTTWARQLTNSTPHNMPSVDSVDQLDLVHIARRAAAAHGVLDTGGSTHDRKATRQRASGCDFE